MASARAPAFSGNLSFAGAALPFFSAWTSYRNTLHRAELRADRIDDPRLERFLAAAAAAAPARILNELVAGMGELFRMTRGENVVLRVHSAEEIWPVAFDVSQLENASLNIAANARDEMPDGGTLTVGVKNGVVDALSGVAIDSYIKPGNYVVVSFSETGDGMTLTVMAQTIEPLFSTKSAIRSEVGQGTTIQMFVPRLNVDEVAPAEITPVAERTASARGETTVVVEDKEMVRTFAVSALRVNGYRVLEAEDGPSALLLLAAHLRWRCSSPTFFLKGPINGFAPAKAASRYRRLLVVYTSGYGRDAIVDVGRLHSGVELLQKPFPVKH